MYDWTGIFGPRPVSKLGKYCPENAIPPHTQELTPQKDDSKAQSLLRKKFIKLRHKCLYINMEYDDILKNFRAAQQHFISSMFSYCDHYNLKAPFEAGASTKPEEEVSAPPTIELKELYREIAKKTHPDRTTELSEVDIVARSALYQEATEGRKLGAFEKVLKVALELDITPSRLTSSYLDHMEDSVTEIEKKITTIKNDIMWHWYYASPEDQEKIFKRLTEKCNSKNDGSDN